MNRILITVRSGRTFRVLASAAHCGALLVFAASFAALAGCGGGPKQQEAQNKNFFTSGSPEADQRASQRMAKSEQLTGSGEGAGEKDVKKAKPASEAAQKGEVPQAAQAENKMSLFERLGGERGITAIVEDFTPRALQDPRVNWARNGVTRGGFWIHRNQSVAWSQTPEEVAALKKHLIQFITLATGGPAHYEGKDLKPLHANMHISNPEFDAAVGDLKASLDNLKIPNTEQKELLAIIESTRPEIVTVR